MKFSMTGQEIGDLLIEVNTWAGLYCILLIHHGVISPVSSNIQVLLHFIDTPHCVISPVSSNIQVLLYFIDIPHCVISPVSSTIQVLLYFIDTPHRVISRFYHYPALIVIMLLN